VIGCGEGPTSTGAPDGGAVSDGAMDDPGAEDSLYASTCIGPVFACFDYQPPCDQTEDTDSGFTASFSNGAKLVINLRDSVWDAFDSKGNACFTIRRDPMNPMGVVIEAPSGNYHLTLRGENQTLTCPDGTTTMIAGPYPAFFEAATSMCRIPGQN
jgi:hypothetical protein